MVYNGLKTMKKIGLLVLVCLFLASCGNNKEDEPQRCTATLKPSSTTIKGDLGDYFQVAEGAATIDDHNLITVKIKKIKEFDFDAEGYAPAGYSGTYVTGNFGFGITVKDKSGNVVKTVRADACGFSGCYSGDDLKTIWEEAVGEENIVRWSPGELQNKEGEFTFTISSFKKEVPQSTASSTSSDNDSKKEYSSAEIDQMLNEVDRLLGQLANLDDMSSAYDNKEEQIINLLSKISSANLTSAQEKRYFQLDDRFDDL